MLKLFTALALVVLMASGAAAAPKTILALGDSLTAGLGVGPAEAFPARLEAALEAKGHDVKVINAGVSGDTAADGAARLDWALSEPVDAVIVELGANDALRGLPVAQAEQALDGLLTALSRKKLPVLLAGMKAPPNMGPEYQAQFDGMYGRLAAKHGVLLYPFFLDGVAADPKLNQGDGMHPNPAGVDVIVARILPSVEQLLGKAGGN
ncbi:arylesterase [Aestuariivirga litoralis]|uniref:Arylesterase n=1 Tax=Aestuariivirga litoralis TaxID=2650924 RepID=A0A2W2BVR9_9HYPH|nr:arylesterase [Aestuariivirga litoralis]PZF77586.1 arylesterase [Aestuariivirga litoralis]